MSFELPDPERDEDAETREHEAREYDRRGNVAMANGLVQLAKRNWRIADAIRRGS